ncbi:hypothetical protein CANINC_003027 [Pichia inconspicua]|uniref:Structural maintenance of chromosomes protein n=1 Tax=Pichia inconspicua TaxID=52247 RepID=A0A4T0X010_9ASCO|nr:hypothetical protein CANINC_003027 [[Candida] inconspicua]
MSEVDKELTDISGALANSSFQSFHDATEEYVDQEAQPDFHEPNNDLFKTPSVSPSKTKVDEVLGNLSNQDDQPKSKDNTIGNMSNISVLALEPIQSPSKQALKELLAPSVSNNPRLVIEKMVLTNFKSYAGRQEIGPFDASFSAVVGPNGSGKSNVIDSMLFVFGFRASKMRQSKLRELIHNSENFETPPPYCQVDIHFRKIIDSYDEYGNNLHNPTEVENSTLVVSRRAMQNNSSTYMINGRNSTYTEVTSLLKAEGIDLDHKRFLILQGEVEMIAQMKPKADKENDDGLLEYLEDIIGTSVYKEEIENLTKQVEELQTSFNEKERIFKLYADEFKTVEKDVAATLEYLKMEKKLKDDTFRYWYLTEQQHKYIMEKQKQILAEENEKIKEDNEQIESYQKTIVNLKKEKNELIQKINDINENISEMKALLKSLEKDQVLLEEDLKVNQKKNDTIQKDLKQNKKVLKSDSIELATIQKKLENYDENIDDLKNKLVTESEQLDQIKLELSSETRKYSDEIEILQEKLEPWKSKIDKTQGTFNIKSSEIELLRGQLTQIKNQRLALVEKEKSNKELIKVNESKIQDLEERKIKTQQDVEQKSKSFTNAKKELKSIERVVNDLRDKVNEARNRVSNVESQNKVLNALNRLREIGRVPGFHGKLGDLGIIDDRYDVAVSTGGGSLSDYVVDTVEEAQECIKYLRTNNLGFGKFIVLNKLKNFNLGRIATPMNVPRLFDLIEPIEPKFAPAFYSSMFDTLVAPNLEIANKVAFGDKKRWRVVTEDGKLVDTSGTMSGGGNRVSRGAMKLRSNTSSNGEVVTPKQLDSWRDDLNEKEKHFHNLEELCNQMDQHLKKNQEDIPLMSAEITRLQMHNLTMKEELKDINQAMKNMVHDDQKILELESKINMEVAELEKLNIERTKLEDKCKDLQNKIYSLQEKIQDIGGIRLRTQTAKVQDLKDEIKLKTTAKDHDEIKASKLSNSIQKRESEITAAESQLESLKENLNATKEALKKKTQEVSKVASEIEKLSSEKDNLANEIRTVDEKIEEQEAELREKSEQVSAVLKQIAKIEEGISKSKATIKHAISSLNGIEYRDVNDYISWMDEDDPEKQLLIQKPLDIEQDLSAIDYTKVDLKQLGDALDSLRVELNDTTVNLDILLTYATKKVIYDGQKKDLEETLTQLNSTKARGDELNEKRHTEFKEGFNSISTTLRSMYRLITTGGTAELEYADSHDAFSEGIVFSVMPPKKSWRTIANLSGGEKTLASLALVFALHHYKPTPLYVMDEIDAALDFKNVSIIANYIKSRTNNAQFIVISLRNNMFELAQNLIGIYKVKNMTRSATLVNKDLIE